MLNKKNHLTNDMNRRNNEAVTWMNKCLSFENEQMRKKTYTIHMERDQKRRNIDHIYPYKCLLSKAKAALINGFIQNDYYGLNRWNKKKQGIWILAF